MRILIDTSVFLWFVNDHRALQNRNRGLIIDRRNESLVSVASIWEMAIKSKTGKLDLPLPFPQFIDKALLDNRFTILPVRISHLKLISELPLHHRDPFDRLLIAQSIVEDIPVLSGDASFDHYPVQRVW